MTRSLPSCLAFFQSVVSHLPSSHELLLAPQLSQPSRDTADILRFSLSSTLADAFGKLCGLTKEHTVYGVPKNTCTGMWCSRSRFPQSNGKPPGTCEYQRKPEKRPDTIRSQDARERRGTTSSCTTTTNSLSESIIDACNSLRAHCFLLPEECQKRLPPRSPA